jgi:hypothetical protein
MMFSLAPKKSVFRYPIAKAAPRVAVLVSWFKAKDPVRVFPHGWCREAEEFAPQAIAATKEQLLQLAALRLEISHALIALTKPGEPLLTSAERDQLWRAFSVPVFEQLVNDNGDLLAAECEAHQGLHLCVTELSGYALDSDPCPCGSRAPRLIPRKPAGRASLATSANTRAR